MKLSYDYKRFNLNIELLHISSHEDTFNTTSLWNMWPGVSGVFLPVLLKRFTGDFPVYRWLPCLQVASQFTGGFPFQNVLDCAVFPHTQSICFPFSCSRFFTMNF